MKKGGSKTGKDGGSNDDVKGKGKSPKENRRSCTLRLAVQFEGEYPEDQWRWKAAEVRMELSGRKGLQFSHSSLTAKARALAKSLVQVAGWDLRSVPRGCKN